MTGRRVSYAQHGEDVVLERALRGLDTVTYVDVGAADSTVDSVSRSLHGLGWRGIHVEPMPSYAERLRAERPGDVVIEAALGSKPGSAAFWFVPGSGLSTMDPDEAAQARRRGWAVHEGTVAVRTLDDVLDEHLAADADIHALKVDVEGSEPSVLRGLDWGRRRPWIVVVEATRPNSTESTGQLWEGLLLDQGYTLTMFDGLNRWYVAAEHAELTEALSYPACPLDPWIRASLAFPDPPQGEPAEVLANAVLAVRAAEALAASAELQARDLHVQLGRAKDQLAEAKARTATAERALQAMQRSSWWRMTSPGRRLVHRLKRRRPADR
jgi:FkbM family methyltransferase